MTNDEKRGFEALLKSADKVKRELDALQAEYDTIMAPVKAWAVDHPGESIEGFGFKVSATAESESVNIDLKLLKEKEPELYDELLRDYPKRTVRKASARVRYEA